MLSLLWFDLWLVASFRTYGSDIYYGLPLAMLAAILMLAGAFLEVRLRESTVQS